jgi:drug/metabolite transporter (DMT)-like permease
LKPFFDRPRLLLIVTALSWAGNLIVGKGLVEAVPPLTLACLRWTLATLLLLPVAWPHLRKEWHEIAKNLGLVLFLAFIGPACFNSLYYLGLVSTEAVNGAVLNAAGPMFIALAAWAVFGDRLDAAQIAGLAAGLLGVLLVAVRGSILSLAALKFNSGDLLLLGAIATWGVYTAFLRKRPPISWQSYSLLTYAIAAAVNIPLAVTELSLGYKLTLNLATIGAISFAAIFPSIVGYVFYNRAVELLGPGPAGFYLFLVPVFGAALATVLLGERLYLFHVLGFALIITGVLIGSRSPANGSLPAAPARDDGEGIGRV